MSIIRRTGAAAWRRCAISGLALGLAAAMPHAPAQDFEPERLKDGVALPADMPRIYVADFAIGHLADGRVHVVDGRNGKFAGVVDAGYAGHFTTSPDGKSLYVATTYMTRHTHGERHDMVEIYDADTLRLTGDVALPTKRAQALYMEALTRTSHDGRYLFVQNATPATSVSVVDVREKKLLAEVATAGCWGIYPSATEALRFSMLCGDGKLATVTLAADGSVAKRAVSPKFFDSSSDPVFVPSAAHDGRHYFVTYTGTLHRADLRGDTPVVEQSVPFVTGADRKAGWRPGGYQLLAFDAARNRVLVGMHPKGAEGSHKSPAQEIWTLDAQTGKRVARTRASNAIALAVGRNGTGTGTGYLYALDGATNQVSAYALPAMRKVFTSDPLGDTPVQVSVP